MKTMTHWMTTSLLAIGALVGGCMSADGRQDAAASGGGDEGGADDGGAPGVGPGVGQGGAQDFGQFRAILEAGEIPGPETLDDIGFFNEHKIELPAADCGEDVCVHGALAQMGNLLTGSDCTMVMIGMNTPIDLAEIDRPPLNLAIAVDTSGSMAGVAIDRVREGLYRMVDALHPEDRVTLVSFSDGAEVRAELSGGDHAAMELAISQLEADGSTNVYEGLWTAYQAVEANAAPGLQNRVLLLSDGEATTGITNDDKIVNLASALSAQGMALSTIGLGDSFDPVLMRRLSEVGSGTFYFVENLDAVEEVFEEEVNALLVPLATNVEMSLDVLPGWEVRALYGTRLADVSWAQAEVAIPSLHIAHRETVDDVEHGRRGGGGVILAEIMRRPGAAPPDGNKIGSLQFSYDIPGTEELVEQTVPVVSGDVAAEAYFETDSAEKSFVMLNLFVGFKIASERATVGDRVTALATLQALRGAVANWLTTHDDFDIEDDLRYVDMFIDNLLTMGAGDVPDTENPPTPPTPPNPWPQD